MTDYTKVYDPKGVMFEVRHELASQLVLNSGWSFKKPEKSVEAPVEEVLVEEADPVAEAAPEEAPVVAKATPSKKVRLN